MPGGSVVGQGGIVAARLPDLGHRPSLMSSRASGVRTYSHILAAGNPVDTLSPTMTGYLADGVSTGRFAQTQRSRETIRLLGETKRSFKPKQLAKLKASLEAILPEDQAYQSITR